MNGIRLWVVAWICVVGLGEAFGQHGCVAHPRPFKKWELPPAAPVPTLDTSSYDEISSTLSLSKEQHDKVEALRKQIAEKLAKLKTAQEEARAAYVGTTTEGAARQAAAKVVAAADDCKAYKPTERFQEGLARILTQDQLAVLQKNLQGGEAETKKPG